MLRPSFTTSCDRWSTFKRSHWTGQVFMWWIQPTPRSLFLVLSRARWERRRAYDGIGGGDMKYVLLTRSIYVWIAGMYRDPIWEGCLWCCSRYTANSSHQRRSSISRTHCMWFGIQLWDCCSYDSGWRKLKKEEARDKKRWGEMSGMDMSRTRDMW